MAKAKSYVLKLLDQHNLVDPIATDRPLICKVPEEGQMLRFAKGKPRRSVVNCEELGKVNETNVINKDRS